MVLVSVSWSLSLPSDRDRTLTPSLFLLTDADEHCLTFAAFEIWNRSLLDSCVEIENKGCSFPVQGSRSGIGLIDVFYTAWLSAAPSGSGEPRNRGPAGARGAAE